VEIDHVLVAVADLAEAARELEARHGLVSLEGGRHPGWGTENRIVPLGDSYLELVAVADAGQAALKPFGRWVAAARPSRAAPLGWAVRPGDLDGVARRLALEVADGARVTRDGQLLSWRLAGVEQAAAEPFLPFFIEWEPGTPFPGAAAAAHRAGRLRVAELGLSGDAGRLAAWLGPHELPLAVDPGPPALTRVVLAGDAGELVLAAGG